MSYTTDKFDDEVVRLLKRGGCGFLPSDTLYGLSCAALNKAAVEKLHRLKDRTSNKPFIILVSDLKMLDLLSISASDIKLINKYWPGALSVIFPSRAPDYLTRGTGSLAVRLPDYPELLELLDQTGPLVSTSANLQGKPPLSSAKEARKLFGDNLDFYIDAGPRDNTPSTLVKIKNGRLEVVRQGAVKIS